MMKAKSSKNQASKVKVGTILDKGLYASVKAQAAQEARSVSDVMEEALRRYTDSMRQETMTPKEAFKRFVDDPFFKNIPKKIWDEVMELDPYER